MRCVTNVMLLFFAKATKSFIKSGSPYIWMHGETGYAVSVWLRRPLTKDSAQQNDRQSSAGLHCIKLIPRDQRLDGISSNLESIQYQCCWRLDEMGAFSGHFHIQCRLGSSCLWCISNSTPKYIQLFSLTAYCSKKTNIKHTKKRHLKLCKEGRRLSTSPKYNGIYQLVLGT